MIADFGGKDTAVKVSGLTQWDRGQTLEIHGLEAEGEVEVHFTAAGRDAIIQIGKKEEGVIEVDIPNSLLEQPKDIIGYIYLNNGKSGKTIREVKIGVEARERPVLWEGEENEGWMRAAIEEVKESAERVEAAAEELKKGIEDKVDKIDGKGLSKNDYTDEEKEKLGGIQEGAEKNQKAFSYVNVGNMALLAATGQVSTLILKPGENIEFEADPTLNTIRITAKGQSYEEMKGATEEEEGAKGLVPAAEAGQEDYFLCGGGTFKRPISKLLADVEEDGIFLSIGSGKEEIGILVGYADGQSGGFMSGEQAKKLAELPTNAELEETYEKKEIAPPIVQEDNVIIEGHIKEELIYTLRKNVNNFDYIEVFGINTAAEGAGAVWNRKIRVEDVMEKEVAICNGNYATMSRLVFSITGNGGLLTISENTCMDIPTGYGLDGAKEEIVKIVGIKE